MEDKVSCPFTQFVQDLVSKPPITEALLHLQHHSGFNINMIFYLLWLSKSSYGRLTKRNINTLQMCIYPWHQRVISELKYTCALVADYTEGPALKIKQALQAEIVKAHMIEQMMLYESKIKTTVLKRSAKQQLEDACHSFMHYCAIKNDVLVSEDRDAWISMLTAVFDQFSRAEVEATVTTVFERIQPTELGGTQLMWEEF